MSTTTEPKISTAKLLFIMATELIIKLDEFEDSNLFKRNMKRTAKAFKAELEKWTDAVYENFKDSKELNEEFSNLQTKFSHYLDNFEE